MLYGLVLAGGKSLRMGHDKSTIAYHGMPQREFIFSILQKFCAQVFLSCKSSANIPETMNPLPDYYEIESPLNGILTAFQKNATVGWISVPVDMPAIGEKTIQYLVEKRNPEKFATCFLDSDGKYPDPLFTIWEPKASRALEKFYQSGGVSPREFLKKHDVEILKSSDSALSYNVNTPEDLQKFLRNLSS
jgi:molybdenum cofactor guanylyltransferase